MDKQVIVFRKRFVGILDLCLSVLGSDALVCNFFSIRDNYGQVISLDIEFAAANEVEQALWKTVLYKQIEELRKLLRQYTSESKSEDTTISSSSPPSSSTDSNLQKNNIEKAERFLSLLFSPLFFFFFFFFLFLFFPSSHLNRFCTCSGFASISETFFEKQNSFMSKC
jgi:hypothetical protein